MSEKYMRRKMKVEENQDVYKTLGTHFFWKLKEDPSWQKGRNSFKLKDTKINRI